MPFSQPKDIYKIYFKTKYQYIDIFEELFTENILSISQYEIESHTVDSLPEDIWCFEVYLKAKPNFPFLKNQIDIYAKAIGAKTDTIERQATGRHFADVETVTARRQRTAAPPVSRGYPKTRAGRNTIAYGKTNVANPRPSNCR